MRIILYFGDSSRLNAVIDFEGTELPHVFAHCTENNICAVVPIPDSMNFAVGPLEMANRTDPVRFKPALDAIFSRVIRRALWDDPEAGRS
jgi:hypothetical protein